MKSIICTLVQKHITETWKYSASPLNDPVWVMGFLLFWRLRLIEFIIRLHFFREKLSTLSPDICEDYVFFIEVKFTWHVVYHFKVYNLLEFSSFMILCSHYTCVLSHLVLLDALLPHGLQPIRLLCPWGFSSLEYRSGLPCPSPGELPDLGIEPGLHCRQIYCP